MLNEQLSKIRLSLTSFLKDPAKVAKKAAALLEINQEHHRKAVAVSARVHLWTETVPRDHLEARY